MVLTWEIYRVRKVKPLVLYISKHVPCPPPQLFFSHSYRKSYDLESLKPVYWKISHSLYVRFWIDFGFIAIEHYGKIGHFFPKRRQYTFKMSQNRHLSHASRRDHHLCHLDPPFSCLCPFPSSNILGICISCWWTKRQRFLSRNGTKRLRLLPLRISATPRGATLYGRIWYTLSGMLVYANTYSLDSPIMSAIGS